MYLTVVENEENYDIIKIDNKIFYKQKSIVQKKPRKRYSDQFKDPTFLQKDIYRKLLMMENFNLRYGDLKDRVEDWKNCIIKCIEILEKEYNILPVDIFKTFRLSKYGFDYNEFGIDYEELKDEFEE